MAWKILASFVAIFLAVSGVFRYLNYEDLITEKRLRQRAEKNLNAMKDRFSEIETEKKETNDEIVVATGLRDQYKKETEETNAKTDNVKGQIAVTTTKRDALDGRLQELKAVEARIGPLEEVIADINRLVAVNEATNEEIATTENIIADTVAKTAENQAIIDDLQALKIRQDLRKMDEEFSASVQRVYGQWGFLVINAGARNEVYTSAELDVVRGGDVIGKVKITNVEPSVAVCDILKETFEDGLSVQPGDTVKTAKQVATAPPVDPVAPGPGVPAPELPKEPGPAAPSIFDAPAGGGMDPFGAPSPPGGAAPAPAAPTPPADPFGL